MTGIEKLQWVGKIVMAAAAYGLGMDRCEADALLDAVDQSFWSVQTFISDSHQSSTSAESSPSGCSGLSPTPNCLPTPKASLVAHTKVRAGFGVQHAFFCL